MSRYRIADVSPKVRALIEDAKKKDHEEKKRDRLKRIVMVPIILTQVAPLATDIFHAVQPLIKEARGDIYEGTRRSR